MKKGWRRFRGVPKNDDGQWIAKLKNGSCVLGQFYCGVFVQDGFCYNETPGIIRSITHIKRVEKP